MKKLCFKIVSFTLALTSMMQTMNVTLNTKSFSLSKPLSNEEKYPLDLIDKQDVPDAIEYDLVLEKGHYERVVEKEDLNTFVFNNIDGTQSRYLFNHPVKYVDSSGNIQDISLQIEKNADSNSYAPVSSNFDVCFNSDLSNGIDLKYDEINISMVPDFVNTNSTYGMLSDDQKRIVYDCKDDISIEYGLTYQGIKENIILDEYTGINEFKFNLKTNGLRMAHDNEVLSLYDNDVVVADFSEILIFDANNNVDVGELHYETIAENQEYSVTVIVDNSFLLDERTVYPVCIDPTVEIRYSTRMINGEYSISHATIYDDDSYSPNSTMYLGNVNGAKSRVLMRFPGFIGQNGMEYNPLDLKSAKLYMRALGYGYNNGEFEISCHYYSNSFLNPWTMSGLASDYSWIIYGDDSRFAQNAICSKIVSESIGNSLTPVDTYEFDITDFLVGSDIYPNKGLIFKADSLTENTSNKYCMFGSYRSGTTGPYVVMDFEVPYKYEYVDDAQISYSYRNRMYLNAGNTYIFQTGKASNYSDCDTELFLFKEEMSPNNNWYSDDISSSNRYSRIEAQIESSGYYVLMAKRYDGSTYSGPALTGYCNVYQINPDTQGQTTVKTNAKLGGYKMVLTNSPNYNKVYNSFTTDLNNSDTVMYAITGGTGSGEKQVVGYNDDYSGDGNYIWGQASRIKQSYQYNNVPSYFFVTSFSEYLNGSADIYALCGTLSDSRTISKFITKFPNFNLDDCIVADNGTNEYRCISYSGGITFYQVNPDLTLNNSILSPWYNTDNVVALDNYYGNNPPRYLGAMTYTVTTNTNEAVINLYKNGDEWTHAAVRAPANNQMHGYDWESKIGDMERVFHPMHALDNDEGYGQIARQYKISDSNQIPLSNNEIIDSIADPITCDESISLGLTKVKNVNIDTANAILESKIRSISPEILNEFDLMYGNWVDCICNSDAYSIESNIDYSSNSEYQELSEFIDNSNDLLYLVIYNYLSAPYNEFISTLFSNKVVYRDKFTIELANSIRENNNSVSLKSLDEDVYILPSFETNAYCFIAALMNENIL